MGGPGSGRFPKKAPGTHLGNPQSAKQRQERQKGAPNRAARDGTSSNTKPANFGQDGKNADIGAVGVPQPPFSSKWHPIVQAWWRALGQSAIAKVAQPADWMNAWVAADVLDHMYNFGFTAGVLQTWVVMADRLHAPHFEKFDVPDVEAPAETPASKGDRAAKVLNLFATGTDE